jgi:pimeloyl-ACP methyl ester carboxylesterase
MEVRPLEVKAADGRRLQAEVAGPEDGELLVFHSGTPEAGMVFEPMVELGSKRGLRHLTYSRPGYRDSDRLEGRTVADCAADVAAIADALGVGRFHTAGASGGGPHALATAALLGDRVIAAATLAGVAPADADGLDWLEGMGEENHREFGAADAGPAELSEYLEAEAAAMAAATGPEIAAALGDLVGEADRRALSGEFAEHVAESLHGALRNGIWGWFDDDLAFVSEWGFDPAAIEVPVTVWHGTDDRFVPLAHGRWLSVNVGRARVRLLDDEGHLSLPLNHYGDILDDLLSPTP